MKRKFHCNQLNYISHLKKKILKLITKTIKLFERIQYFFYKFFNIIENFLVWSLTDFLFIYLFIILFKNKFKYFIKLETFFFTNVFVILVENVDILYIFISSLKLLLNFLNEDTMNYFWKLYTITILLYLPSTPFPSSIHPHMEFWLHH